MEKPDDTRSVEFLVALALSTSAWALSVSSTAYCNYVLRDIVLVPGQEIPPLVDEWLRLAFEDHGVGFWAWVLNGRCQPYCNRFGSCPDFDTKFETARAFTAVTDIIGGVGMFLLWFQFCCPGDLKCVPVFFFWCVLFEGLTLLILRSNICTDPGFFNYLLAYYDQYEFPQVQSVSCSLNRGSYMTIAATVLWFFASLAAVKVVDARRKDDEEE